MSSVFERWRIPGFLLVFATLGLGHLPVDVDSIHGSPPLVAAGYGGISQQLGGFGRCLGAGAPTSLGIAGYLRKVLGLSLRVRLTLPPAAQAEIGEELPSQLPKCTAPVTANNCPRTPTPHLQGFELGGCSSTLPILQVGS